MMADEADHLRSLVARYVQHVIEQEGVDFLTFGASMPSHLTEDEKAELSAIHREHYPKDGYGAEYVP